MKTMSLHIIQTARDGVDELDALRRAQGISQMKISDLADTPDVGQQYARMYGRGDVMLSKYLRFLRSVGCRLAIIQEVEANDNQRGPDPGSEALRKKREDA